MKIRCNILLNFGVNEWVLSAEEKCCIKVLQKKILKNVWPSKPVYEAWFLQEKNPKATIYWFPIFFSPRLEVYFFFHRCCINFECCLISLVVWKQLNFRYDWFCGKLCFPQQLHGSFISESCLSRASAMIANYRNCAINNFTGRYWSWNGLPSVKIPLCWLLLLHWFNLQRNIVMKIEKCVHLCSPRGTLQITCDVKHWLSQQKRSNAEHLHMSYFHLTSFKFSFILLCL